MEVQSQSQSTNQNMSSLVSRSKLKTPKSRGSVAFQGTVYAHLLQIIIVIIYLLITIGLFLYYKKLQYIGLRHCFTPNMTLINYYGCPPHALLMKVSIYFTHCTLCVLYQSDKISYMHTSIKEHGLGD